MISQQEILNRVKQKKKFVVEHDGTWYSNRFKYKLSFDFGIYDGAGQRTTWRLNTLYQDMIDEFEKNLWEFRKRREVQQSFFTSDEELIEYVLDDDRLLNHLHTLYYTSNRYNTNKSILEQNGIITDIKFRREVGDYPFQVYLGDWDYRDRSIQESACEWVANSYKEGTIVASSWNEDVIKRYISQSTPFMYNGFNCYMKSEDDIMMLHFIAPGHIKKVFQILKKDTK